MNCWVYETFLEDSPSFGRVVCLLGVLGIRRWRESGSETMRGLIGDDVSLGIVVIAAKATKKGGNEQYVKCGGEEILSRRLPPSTFIGSR